MTTVAASLVETDQAAWLEVEFNRRWPWPRPSGFVTRLIATCPHIVAADSTGGYLGHCHIRRSPHQVWVSRLLEDLVELGLAAAGAEGFPPGA